MFTAPLGSQTPASFNPERPSALADTLAEQITAPFFSWTKTLSYGAAQAAKSSLLGRGVV